MNFLLSLFISLLLSGCMPGTSFKQPPAPSVKNYTESKLPRQTVGTQGVGTAGKIQRFVDANTIPAEWWRLFHSEALNQLICQGLANSPNLVAAQAALRQAKETLNAEVGGSLLPTVDAQFAAQRGRSIGNQLDPSQAATFNLFNPTVNVTYKFDLFGSSRHQIEKLAAQVDYEQFLLEAAYTTLTANIVTTAITAASFQEQVEATRQLIELQTNTLNVLNKQLHAGGVSTTDVLSQETQLAQTRATLPPLMQNLAKSRHALAVLIGEFPNNAKLPIVRLEQLNLPETLPVTLPSQVVRQRPDIRASEALLHAASAHLGVATANLFPQINLSASYGFQGTDIQHLFNPIDKVWNIAGSVLQPIFHGGALHAQRRAAAAGLEQAHAQYRQTVLQAFQNVADTLRALENDALALHAAQQAEQVAHRAWLIAKKQLHLGGTSYLSLLEAERQYQHARLNLIQAKAARFSDTAALYQALGGGWWNQGVHP